MRRSGPTSRRIGAASRRARPAPSSDSRCSAGLIFVGSYAGWFIETGNGGGWDRFWAQANHSDVWPAWTDPMRSLWHFVTEQYQFDSTLEIPHPYQSQPWAWSDRRPAGRLLLAAPRSAGRAAPRRWPARRRDLLAEVLPLGNPLLW